MKGAYKYMQLLINESLKSEEELEKEKEYMKYLKAHIDGVKRNFDLYFSPLAFNSNIRQPVLYHVSVSELIAAIKDKAFTIQDHDASKYDDVEFYPYRKHWYPTMTEKGLGDEYIAMAEQEYEDAVNHHYKMNEHHQKHWVDANNTLLDMPLSAIVEMICDWLSISDYYKSSTLDWWNSDESAEEKANMTEKTRIITEDLLYNFIFA